MEILQRLQALDVVFAILWAGVIGWGLQAGVVRQLGMLVGIYGSAVASGALYRQVGQGLSKAFGAESLPQLEFVGYTVVLVVAFGLIALTIWRAYPRTRLGRGFGADNLVGALLAAVWGTLALIALLTIMRFYALVPWHGQESVQQGVRDQIQLSQVAPVLEVAASPLWQLMAPWFPRQVPTRL
jgi:hypothetical protein